MYYFFLAESWYDGMIYVTFFLMYLAICDSFLDLALISVVWWLYL